MKRNKMKKLRHLLSPLARHWRMLNGTPFFEYPARPHPSIHWNLTERQIRHSMLTGSISNRTSMDACGFAAINAA